MGEKNINKKKSYQGFFFFNPPISVPYVHIYYDIFISWSSVLLFLSLLSFFFSQYTDTPNGYKNKWTRKIYTFNKLQQI